MGETRSPVRPSSLRMDDFLGGSPALPVLPKDADTPIMTAPFSDSLLRNTLLPSLGVFVSLDGRFS
jgi:hypothetical protein